MERANVKKLKRLLYTHDVICGERQKAADAGDGTAYRAAEELRRQVYEHISAQITQLRLTGVHQLQRLAEIIGEYSFRDELLQIIEAEKTNPAGQIERMQRFAVWYRHARPWAQGGFSKCKFKPGVDTPDGTQKHELEPVPGEAGASAEPQQGRHLEGGETPA